MKCTTSIQCCGADSGRERASENGAKSFLCHGEWLAWARRLAVLVGRLLVAEGNCMRFSYDH
jgi:hypothetical protein